MTDFYKQKQDMQQLDVQNIRGIRYYRNTVDSYISKFYSNHFTVKLILRKKSVTEQKLLNY